MSRLIAPNVGLNRAEKIKIVTKAGTAQGKINTVLIVRLNFIRLSLTNNAKKNPNKICNVVATTVQTIVHVRTLKNVSFHVFILMRAIKLSIPIQFSKFRGGALY